MLLTSNSAQRGIAGRPGCVPRDPRRASGDQRPIPVREGRTWPGQDAAPGGWLLSLPGCLGVCGGLGWSKLASRAGQLADGSAGEL